MIISDNVLRQIEPFHVCLFKGNVWLCLSFSAIILIFWGGLSWTPNSSCVWTSSEKQTNVELNTTYGGGVAFKKREDKVFWVVSLQPGGVYILYICTKLVCLCVLCRVREFFFLAWLPWIPDTKGDINKTQGFNHSAHKKASSRIVRSLSVGSLIVCRSTDIEATIGGQCQGVISLWQHFQSVDIFFKFRFLAADHF